MTILVRSLLEIKIRSRAKNNLGKTFKKGGIFGKHCLSFRFLQNRFPKALTWYFETSEPMLPTQATSAKWCTKTMGQSDPDKSKGCQGLIKRSYCGFAQIVRLHLDANKAPQLRVTCLALVWEQNGSLPKINLLFDPHSPKQPCNLYNRRILPK